LDPTELIARCRQGDDLAWEALVKATQGRVYAVALHYMRDREEAKDMAQEVFVRVFHHLDALEGDRPFLPWLLQIARNACVDRLRRLKVRTPPNPVPVEDGPQIPAAEPSPEEEAITGARERLLYRALGTLAEHYREMIVLKEIQGLKLEEICELLDLPMGTAKSRSHRAKLELSRAVRELQPDFGAAS
jgi:RNA polymerase sigma-70 factor (ECF subfamily)